MLIVARSRDSLHVRASSVGSASVPSPLLLPTAPDPAALSLLTLDLLLRLGSSSSRCPTQTWAGAPWFLFYYPFSVSDWRREPRTDRTSKVGSANCPLAPSSWGGLLRVEPFLSEVDRYLV